MKKFIACLAFGLLAIQVATPGFAQKQPGSLLWKSKTDGSKSSPAIGTDGTVYVGSSDHKVYALDGKTGVMKWVSGTKERRLFGIHGSPAIGADGTVYVGSGDYQEFYALDGQTGRTKWIVETLGFVLSSPAIGSDGTVYVQPLSNSVYALDGITGAKKWRPRVTLEKIMQSSVAIGTDGTIYIGAFKKVYARDGRTGDHKWEFDTGSHEAYPVIGTSDTIYIGSGKKIYAVDGKNIERFSLNGSVHFKPKKKWEFVTDDTVLSSLAIGTDGTVYVGSLDGKIYALDGQTGTKKWQFVTGARVDSSPAIGSDGTVYIGSHDHKVYALDGKTGVKKWEFVTGHPVPSSPAIGTDGTLYVGSGDYLYAIKTASLGLANSPWPMFGQNPQHTGRTATIIPTVTTSAQKAEVPAKAAIKKATEELKTQLFKTQFKNAVTNAQKNKLAKQLISVANETKDDLPGKYALLKAALDLRVDTNNFDLGMTAIKQIDSTFVVDRHGLSISFLGKLAKSRLDEQVIQKIVKYCLAAQPEFIGQDKQFVRYIAKYREIAISVLEPGGKKEKEITRVKERSAYAETTAQAFLDLKADADNGAANQLAGLHLLTSRDQLPDAIRHFLKSDNELFRHAAELEQQKLISFETETALVEAWLATGNPHAALRADYWLSQATKRLAQLNGLTLIRKKALLTDLKKHIELSGKRVGKLIVNSIGMNLTLIPAGEFQMGSGKSPADIARRFGLPEENERFLLTIEHPQHRVTINKSFYMAVHEVTQQQYEKLMGTRPWAGKFAVKEGADYPASSLSWHDAVEFCRKLSKKEGVEYRLPTEAEWEYACRAGTTTVYSFGDDVSKLGQYAWNVKNTLDIGEKYAHRVGQKLPNPWGLYDMHGNVYEYCQDSPNFYPGLSKYLGSTEQFPVLPKSMRMLRGGFVGGNVVETRSAARFIVPDGKEILILPLGFRPVRVFP